MELKMQLPFTGLRLCMTFLTVTLDMKGPCRYLIKVIYLTAVKIAIHLVKS